MWEHWLAGLCVMGAIALLFVAMCEGVENE